MAVEVSHTKQSLVVRVGCETDESMLRALAEALENLGTSDGSVVVDLTGLEPASAADEFVERFERMAAHSPTRPCALVADRAVVAEWPPLPAVHVFASLEAAIAACDAPEIVTRRDRAHDPSGPPADRADPGMSAGSVRASGKAGA